MNRPLDHLTDALIDQYTKQSSGTFDAQDAGVEAHLANCGSCLDRVLQSQRVHLGLLEADPVNRAPHPDCPEEQVLQQLAAGISSPEEASQALQHAARCSHCGPLLNRYLEEFSEELRPEDQAILNQLATGKPAWQEQFVRKHALVSPEKRPKRSFLANLWPQGAGWWPKMALAGALAILVVAITLGQGLWSRFELYRADRLVAAAYAERRTTEMRLTNVPYAAYSSMPVERGDNDPQLGYERPALSDASALVGRKLKSGKMDSTWLQIQGRVSLLQGTDRSLADAESALEKARSAGADNPGAEIDLAAAYFERDSKTNPPNLQRTINLLNEVLHHPKLSKQDRSVALFDLALAYEKTQAWDMAVPIWEQYLQLDPSSPWAKEAEIHLTEAKSKIHPPREQGYDRPSFFLSHVTAGSLPAEAEEYQNIALELWLPRAVEDKDSDSYKAVVALSELMEQQHSDPWLKDLVAALQPGDLSAIKALGAAVLANEEELHDQALDEARSAAQIFSEHRNRAGELRAEIEEVYAVRRSLRASDCLKHAISLGSALSGTRYRWLQAQILLEIASCQNSHGELQDVSVNLAQSRRIAESSRFPVLVLRNIAISAGIKHKQHKYDDAWRESVTGVNRYWQGTYPPERLEQLYAVMWECAKDSDSFHAAQALLQHTLDMRSDPSGGIKKNVPLEILLHSSMANIYIALKENALAAEENHKGSLLKKQLADYSGNYGLISKIETADLQLEQTDAEFALSTLIPVGELLKTAQDNFISLNYFRVLGDTYLQLKQFNQASSAYWSAIQIADNTLYSLKDSGRRLQWMKAADESYRGMVRVLLEKKEDEQALQFWERYKGRSLREESHANGFDKRAGINHTKVTSVAAKTALSSTQVTRLTYATFEDGLQVWVTSGKSIQSKWIKIKQEELAHDIRDFVEKCAASGSDLADVQIQGKKLFSIFLQPVILQLPESRSVIVELDRPAYALPIEALMSPDGWYFGGRYSIVYSPGLMMENDIRVPEAIGLQEPLLLVDASRTDSGSYLPGDDLERKTIADVFPNSRIMDSGNASWRQVAHALSESHVFHFIGHGKPDGTGAYLVLNKAISLKATDFAPDLLKSSHLAVLSACSTGIGGEEGLLDTDNLVHSFLSAGVPSVIASRWNVDSENTAKLMSSFYRHLEKKETVAQSISNARKEILATQKHPYYWASFNLSGRTN